MHGDASESMSTLRNGRFNRMTQCPYCREAIPEIRVSKRHNPAGRKKIRQGLLYMLLAGVAYYFAGGYSGWQLPITIQPMVTTYFIPLLFFGGLGLSLYGLYVHIMSLGGKSLMSGEARPEKQAAT